VEVGGWSEEVRGGERWCKGGEVRERKKAYSIRLREVSHGHLPNKEKSHTRKLLSIPTDTTKHKDALRAKNEKSTNELEIMRLESLKK